MKVYWYSINSVTTMVVTVRNRTPMEGDEHEDTYLHSAILSLPISATTRIPIPELIGMNSLLPLPITRQLRKVLCHRRSRVGQG